MTKPSCFVVLGKPGAGKTTLASQLAIYWKCQHINGKCRCGCRNDASCGRNVCTVVSVKILPVYKEKGDPADCSSY